MVTVIVLVSLGLIMRSETLASGSTDAFHRSPVSDVMAGSNSLVWATMARLAVPAGAPPSPKGPISAGLANHKPGATGLAVKAAVATLPYEVALRSGSPAP